MSRITLGEFVWKRIKEAGCGDVFGVPGDFNLILLDALVAGGQVNYVGCCNELNAAYSADGYARVRGLGCCVTTYAVGELSACNGIAGAYAECVPVVKITGAPACKLFKEQPLVHHTLGDYMAPFKMYEKITVDQCLLNDPKTAARDFNRCLRSCLLQKRPVYVAIPSDMVNQTIVDEPWEPPANLESDEVALREALDEVKQRMAAARSPVLIPGVELIRRNLQDLFEQLTTRSCIPYTTMLLSKGVISETHPNNIGLYMGARSHPDVKKAVDDSDCVLILGEKLTDFNTGGFSTHLTHTTRILVDYDQVVIGAHIYHKVYLGEFLRRLVEDCGALRHADQELPTRPRASDVLPFRRDSDVPAPDPSKPLSLRYVYHRVAKMLPDNCVFVAETGSSMFAAAETLLPAGATYIGQTFYGSIGYSVGACLGACIALKGSCPRRRVVLMVGDGSFQLTAQEVSTMIRYNCDPVIVLINNDGYTIERVITDNVYNNIQMWQYAKLPLIFGATKEGFKCTDEVATDAAFSYAQSHPDELVFIETVTERWDCNRLLKAAGRMMALNNTLEPSVSEEMIQNSDY